MEIALLIAGTMGLAITCYMFGYYTGIRNGEYQITKNVGKYVATNFPTQWAAYRKGVDEGYDQGLRDAEYEPS